jgi:NADH:ubiquinone oxidoreductase subunit 5 (subunit L)/multisubunit Na+/H+ antiporter MnhA subunit
LHNKLLAKRSWGGLRCRPECQWNGPIHLLLSAATALAAVTIHWVMAVFHSQRDRDNVMEQPFVVMVVPYVLLSAHVCLALRGSWGGSGRDFDGGRKPEDV